MPKRIVKIWVGFKVLWLEEIRPKDQEFLLALVGFFFLDGCVSGHRVEVGSHG